MTRSCARLRLFSGQRSSALVAFHKIPPRRRIHPIRARKTKMAIRDARKQWAAAAQAKDPEKFASFYADDAVLMLSGGCAAFRKSRNSRRGYDHDEGSGVRALI
jgi:hypothetical protein